MKKSRNGFIKNLHYLCLGAVLGLMTIGGCGGGGGGEGGAPPAPSQTAPRINNVELFNVDDPDTPTVTFNMGDTFNFRVSATDPDLDMTTLYFYQYYPITADTPYSGPITVLLPSQPETSVVCTANEPLTITNTGQWRFEFQIEDSEGNQSNVFTVYVISGQITLADLVGTYKLNAFTVTYDGGTIVTQDDVSSYSGTMSITSDGIMSQTVEVNGVVVSSPTTILSVENDVMQISSAGCTYDLGIELSGNIFTTTFSSGTCGVNYREVDVWEKTSSSAALSKVDELAYDEIDETISGGAAGSIWNFLP